MGRDAGFIALWTGLATGAESILVPETSTNLDSVIQTLESGYKRNKASSIIVVAEGDDADMKNLVRYMKREKEIVGQQQLGQGIPFTCLTVLDSEKAGLIYPPDQIKQEKEVEHIKMTREAILSKARGMM
jgi:6-phosphofructokinase